MSSFSCSEIDSSMEKIFKGVKNEEQAQSAIKN